ncbi:MAG: 2,3-bisphosphoglycerate-independent phosphoglycerate mutase [Methanospirillum sp.]|nr:2,3-bisphosphoglycerate-independent phosphoglycerate mutase [Methanospirillum sp.]
MTARRIVLIVLDGIGDRPHPALGGATPLSAARTPVLDRFAREGVTGIMDTIAPGIRPGSDTSHLALLGYPPEECYTGRGPLEAEGSGIRMLPGMIGFRANYATVGPDGAVTDRRAGRIQGTAPLSKAIEVGVDLSPFGVSFRFVSGAGHRAALALKGPGLGDGVSSNDPKHEGIPPIPFASTTDRPEDEKTAAVLNEFVRQARPILLEHPLNRERQSRGLHPANEVLLRGAGLMGNFEPFEERYGLRGAVVSAATLITGIGKVVGLETISVEGATGSLDSNIEGKVRAAGEALADRGFVLLNIKGADESGHDGKPEQKRDFIERIDGALEPLLALDETVIAICGDHSTPCVVKDHSADPVPVLIHGEGVRPDRVESYDEFACAEGGLHRIRGRDLLPILMDLIGKAHKYGA